MKHLTLVVHGNVQLDLADKLRGIEQVQGFTFTHVEGHGAHVELDPFQSGRDRVVGYVPRTQVEVLLDDCDVESVLAVLCEESAGFAGLGVYWVTTVEQYGRL